MSIDNFSGRSSYVRRGLSDISEGVKELVNIPNTVWRNPFIDRELINVDEHRNLIPWIFIDCSNQNHQMFYDHGTDLLLPYKTSIRRPLL